MTEAQKPGPSLVEVGRALRDAWDALPPGDRATLRRCATPHELQLEGAYWRLVRAVPQRLRERAGLAAVCFPACEATASERFRFGEFLRSALVKPDQKDDDVLRVRQLLASRSEDELAHRLRRLLKHIDRPLDWGVLFADLMQWSADEEARARVCRRWARDFYTPSADETDAADDAATTTL